MSKEDTSYHGNSYPYVQKLEKADVIENQGSREDPQEIANNRNVVDISQLEKQVQHKKLPSIFSLQLKEDRKILLKSILRIEGLLFIIVLGILSIYWGGLASLLPNQKVLTIAIVDFDGQEVGSALTQFGTASILISLMEALEQRQHAERTNEPTLGYITQAASMYNDDPAMLQVALLNEKMWVAISVRSHNVIFLQ